MRDTIEALQVPDNPRPITVLRPGCGGVLMPECIAMSLIERFAAEGWLCIRLEPDVLLMSYVGEPVADIDQGAFYHDDD